MSSAARQMYKIVELTTKQKSIIKASVPILEKSGLDVTKTFYDFMLTTYPQVKPFFNETNQKTLAQPKILAHALLNYAKNIDDLAPLTEFVQQIVVKHCGLQIKAEHYPYVGNSLIHTLKEMLGPKIADAEFIEAWGAAYGNLAQLLIDSEFKVYQSQLWDGFKDFKVTKIVDECSDVKSVYFTPIDGSKIELPIRGQYLGFRFTTPGSEIAKSREYSISQYPTTNEYKISVRKLEGGAVSTYIHQDLKVGDTIKVAPPVGRLTYQENDKDVVAFVGGIGITPMISIIEKALADGKKVKLLYSNRSNSHKAFGSWEKELSLKYGNFECIDFLTSEEHILNNEDINALDLNNKEIYLVGPVSYMHFVQDQLKSHGITKFNSEFYGPTVIE